MAAGTHWEWRGFGLVTPAFADQYATLDGYLAPHQLADLYIWLPDRDVNLKVRQDQLGTLKFKRLLDKHGRFELWREDPAQYVSFPLTRQSWGFLAEELVAAGYTLAPYPDGPADCASLIAALKFAGCPLIRVLKRREIRLWQGADGRVLVEMTLIKKPQPIFSIALETVALPDGACVTAEQAEESLTTVIAALGLQRQPLQAMNYLDALAVWADGGRL